jgi:hypothetical protein
MQAPVGVTHAVVPHGTHTLWSTPSGPRIGAHEPPEGLPFAEHVCPTVKQLGWQAEPPVPFTQEVAPVHAGAHAEAVQLAALAQSVSAQSALPSPSLSLLSSQMISGPLGVHIVASA